MFSLEHGPTVAEASCRETVGAGRGTVTGLMVIRKNIEIRY